ncbi:lysozyme inhibitor LprI family protein [Butyrivibrio sp. LC3010]|uniref:lysozyme inhibitor LprI family protein n=1 Tax=Butyrivibrio sp. LC3010 TaxID=1280680 RepID=UPI000419FB9F|nr:lysozyme inhibitor LprI family protein [Butyrivibrio sp. LC3010]
MKKRLCLTLIISMIGLYGCTPIKDSDVKQNSEVVENQEENTDEQDNAIAQDDTEKMRPDVVIENPEIEKDEPVPEGSDSEAGSDVAANAESEDTVSDESISTDMEASDDTDQAETDAADTDTQSDDAVVYSNPIADSFVLSDDLSHDYDKEIKDAVTEISSSASTVQDELNGIEALERRFNELTEKAETQVEINQTAKHSFDIWDSEINNLWSRVNKLLDAASKDNLLQEQRKWISVKDKIVPEALGPREEGGSIYPMLELSLFKDITKRRCYYLATIIADKNGEAFTLPKRSITGAYVDDQDTDDIYSSLIITESMESGYNATISIYRTATVEGTVTKEGSDLIFTSYDESVKGIIRYGWSGASLEITEAGADSVLKKGDVYEFKMTI